MRYIAYTTKGLEEVTKIELQEKLEKFSIEESGDKRIIFSTSSSIKELLDLKTVDDLGVLVGKVNNIKTNEDLLQYLDKDSFFETQGFIKKYRNIDPNSFSITLSVAKSLIKASELSTMLQGFVTDNFKWKYTELDHSNFDIRIFIDGKNAYISVRLTKESLHNRVYKINSKPGSLKPTIAAAMVILTTNFQDNLRIVDNFCGSGTILCESHLSGNDVFGGDIDPENIEITKVNLKNLGYKPEDKIKILDARRTNWQDSYFDCAISNLPWDKQIEVASITNLYENSIREYFKILKPTGSLCVIVSKPELFVKYVKKFKPNANIKSFKIGLLGQNPTIVLVN